MVFKILYLSMMIENTDNNKVTVSGSPSVNGLGSLRSVNYLKYLETTSKSKAKQSDIDKLADEVNSSWWEANKLVYK